MEQLLICTKPKYRPSCIDKLVVLFALFFFQPLNAQLSKHAKRTVVEVRSINPSNVRESLNSDYKYYFLIQWIFPYYPRILAEGKIDSVSKSFKLSLNLHQSGDFSLLMSEKLVKIDELGNYPVPSGETIDLFLEPGDSLVLNCDLFDYLGKIEGRGAENNKPINYKFYWPSGNGDFSVDFVNYWQAKNYKVYTDALKNLEKTGSNYSAEKYQSKAIELRYKFYNNKLEFIRHFIKSGFDSISFDKGKLFESVEKLQRRVFPEMLSTSLINDSFLNIPSYCNFVEYYTAYRYSFETRTKPRFNFFPFDGRYYDFAAKVLPLRSKEYYCAFLIIQGLGKPDQKKEIEPYYKKYIEEFPKGEYSDMIRKAFASRGELANGKLAPDFTLKNQNGQPVSLRSFRGKNLLLVFYEEEDMDIVQNFDNIVAGQPNMERINIYVGNDSLVFNRFSKQLPDAVHLNNANWQSAKEYNINTLIYGRESRIYLVDKNGILINYDPSVNLEFILYKHFNKSKAFSENNSNIWLLILVSLAVLFIGGAVTWIIIRWHGRIIVKAEEEKRKQVEVELRAIRAQLNPHFMFNSLSSIQNLINSSKVQDANLYLSKFADLMRLILKNSEKTFIPIKDELDAITAYCDLEKLRFNFDYIVDVDASVDIYNTEIPGMLLQPYVENAILHGLNYLKDRKGLLTIKLTTGNNNLIFLIEDNGIGLKASEEIKLKNIANTNGYGNRLASERIDLLNSCSNHKVSVSVQEKINLEGISEGTLVQINFPIFI